MPFSVRTVLRPLRTPYAPTIRTLTTSRPSFASSTDTAKWKGRQPDEHTTDSKDELDVESEASGKGQRAKAADDTTSNATSQRDTQGAQKKAKEEHPESPKGPIIGMNDEKGGKTA